MSDCQAALLAPCSSAMGPFIAAWISTNRTATVIGCLQISMIFPLRDDPVALCLLKAAPRSNHNHVLVAAVFVGLTNSINS